VIEHGADMIAFDDFDRCFLFDEKVSSEGYYIVGLLAEAFLEKNPGRRLSTTRACPGTPWMW
jgi:phosphomannomutase